MTKILIIVFCLLLSCAFILGGIRVKRIIGGQLDDSVDQLSLAALIGEKGYSWDILKVWGEHRKLFCSGSLISNQWIVTAAHCFNIFKVTEEKYENENENSSNFIHERESKSDENLKAMQKKKFTIKNGKVIKIKKELIDFTDPKYWKVRLAVQTLKPTFKERLLKFVNRFFDKPNQKVYYKVSKVVRHPMYDPNYLENDVALVKLKNKINMTIFNFSRILPITNSIIDKTLWPYPGQMCKVIGWGCKEIDGPIMNRLHSVLLPVQNSSYCRLIYRADINLTDHQEFCAGYYNGHKGICAGDSGGPILCLENGKPVLAGVVSATHKNDPSKFPGIFSRISYFSSWISNVIKNN